MDKKRTRTVGAVGGAVGGFLGVIMTNILLPSCTMIVRVIVTAVICGGIAAIACLIVSALLDKPKDEQNQ